ncbi:MAG: bacillithiol biosynthesis deacetylase BshB1 [Flammeovirgaceae bacterium]|nr:bacillithiol biosynthesis deacetylase BshB1 [Flammeovirgaceae bacterium]
MVKLDILVIASHPDDAELGCGGTIAKQISLGNKVGILDLTQGELGTRGTPEIRAQEAAESTKILNLTIRENLGLPDGFFKNDREHQIPIIQTIRKYRPEIILANAVTDRHPDHGKGAQLAYDASFLAGLTKVKTSYEDKNQDEWRPKSFYHYIQSQWLKPDFIVDVSDFWEVKMRSINAYKSQVFTSEKRDEPETYISSKAFIEMVEGRAKDLGHAIGAQYGEGFIARKFLGISNLFDLR